VTWHEGLARLRKAGIRYCTEMWRSSTNTENGHVLAIFSSLCRLVADFNNSDSVHTSIFPTILYKPCTVAALEHLEHLLPKNHICIIAVAPDLRRALFHGVT
jgi:hypothetical protein